MSDALRLAERTVAGVYCDLHDRMLLARAVIAQNHHKLLMESALTADEMRVIAEAGRCVCGHLNALHRYTGNFNECDLGCKVEACGT